MDPIRAKFAGTCARTGKAYPAGSLIVQLANKKWALAQDKAGNVKIAPPLPPEPDYRTVRLPNGKIREHVNLVAPQFCGDCLKADNLYEAAQSNIALAHDYQFQRQADDFICPRCGRRVHVLSDAEIWQEVTLPVLHFTGTTLSHTVGPAHWEPIKHYFEYISYHDLAEMYEDEDEFDVAEEYRGRRGGEWQLRDRRTLETVEEILGILPDNRRAVLDVKDAARKAAEREAARLRQERERAFRKGMKTLFDWKQGEILWGEDLGLTEGISGNSGRIPIRLQGETLPIGEGQNIYGSGSWFVLDTDGQHVWHVQNNGMDGDDWSRNNVRTGGAGAVGRRFPLTPERVTFLDAYVRKTEVTP